MYCNLWCYLVKTGKKKGMFVKFLKLFFKSRNFYASILFKKKKIFVSCKQELSFVESRGAQTFSLRGTKLQSI